MEIKLFHSFHACDFKVYIHWKTARFSGRIFFSKNAILISELTLSRFINSYGFFIKKDIKDTFQMFCLYPYLLSDILEGEGITQFLMP